MNDDWKEYVKTFTLKRAIITVTGNNNTLSRDEIFTIIHNAWKLPHSREQFDKEFDRLLKDRTLGKDEKGYYIASPGDDEE